MNKIFTSLALILSLGTNVYAQFCPGCVQSSSLPQVGQFNVSSGIVRGALTVGSINISTITVTSVTAGAFVGTGTYLTNLNASELGFGTVPSARISGSYPALTGVGPLTSGAWQGSIIGSTYGGTGANMVTASTGSIPYFAHVGTMSALAPGTATYLLQTNGASSAPSWTGSPQVLGTNVTSIPMANLIPGQLPTNISVNDASISTVSAAKVIGSIPGNSANINGILSLTQLSTGTLVNTIVASSITVTGVTPGIWGGPARLIMQTVGADGRISSISQSTFSVGAASITSGALPAGVTIGATQITGGVLGNTVIVSSLNVTGVAPGSYGFASQVSSFVVRSDGRISFADQVPIAINTNQINNGTLTAGVVVPPVNIQAGVIPLNVVASSVAATGISAGTYGTPTNTLQVTVGSDGRLSAINQYAIPGVSTNSVASNVDNAWTATQTFFSSVTIHGNLSAQNFTATNLAGNGASLTSLTSGNISSGTLPSNVIASSIAATSVSSGSYGSASQVPTYTVSGDGRLTSSSNTTIAISESQVSNLVSDLASKASTGTNSTITKLTGLSSITSPFTETSSVTNTSSGGLLVESSVTAGSFFGDGSHLSNVPSGESNTYTSSKTFTSFVLGKSSITAGAFFGDGSQLTGTPAIGSSGQITYNNSGTMAGSGLSWDGIRELTINGSAGDIFKIKPFGESSKTILTANEGAELTSSGVNASLTMDAWQDINLTVSRNVNLSAASGVVLTNSSTLLGVSSITAGSFFGDASHLSGIASTSSITSLINIRASSGTNSDLSRFLGSGTGLTISTQVTLTSSMTLVNVPLTFSGASGAIVSVSSITAGAFFGDGSHLSNVSTGTPACVFGNAGNTSVVCAPVGGGNSAPFTSATTSGGSNNHATGTESTVCGGSNNNATGSDSIACAGTGNSALTNNAAVFAGFNNTSRGAYAFIGAGQSNRTFHEGATIPGGEWNTVGTSTVANTTGLYATIPGGYGNLALQDNTFAAGILAQAISSGSFVLALATNTAGPKLFDHGANTFNLYAPGGIYLSSGTVYASTFNATGSVYQVDGVTVIDSNKNFITNSSVTASAFFGDASHLSNVTATNVSAAGVQAGALGPSVIASSIAVNAINNGNQLSSSLSIPPGNVDLSTVTTALNTLTTNLAATSASTQTLATAVAASTATLAINLASTSASTQTIATNLAATSASTQTIATNLAATSASTQTLATSVASSTTTLFNIKASSGVNADLTNLKSLTTVTSAVTYTSSVTINSNLSLIRGSTIAVDGNVYISSSSSSLTPEVTISSGAGGSMVVVASITAGAFFGDGSNLTGVSGSGGTDFGPSTAALSIRLDSVAVATTTIATNLAATSASTQTLFNIKASTGANADISSLAGSATGLTISTQTTFTSSATFTNTAISVVAQTSITTNGQIQFSSSTNSTTPFVTLSSGSGTAFGSIIVPNHATACTSPIAFRGASANTGIDFTANTWTLCSAGSAVMTNNSTSVQFPNTNGRINIVAGVGAVAAPNISVVGDVKSGFTPFGTDIGHWAMVSSGTIVQDWHQVVVGTNTQGNSTFVGLTTVTIQGNAFGVGVSSFVVNGGLVGIGTANPTTKLHLSSGTFTLDGTAPIVKIGTMTINGTTSPPNAFALCFSAGTLGHCTSVVGIDGSCTCTTP